MQVWNDELAQVAQDYAEMCLFEHNTARVASQSTFSSVGENLFAGTGPAEYTAAVESWYNEKQDYDYDNNTCSAVCGHYTQVSAHFEPSDRHVSLWALNLGVAVCISEGWQLITHN